MEQTERTHFWMLSSGWSMTPFLKDGDHVLIRRIPVEQLRIGDIIAYRDVESGQIVCHRMVRRCRSNEQWCVATRGDASGCVSSPIAQEHVLGRVVLFRRGKTVHVMDDMPWRLANVVAMHAFPLVQLARRIKRVARRCQPRGLHSTRFS